MKTKLKSFILLSIMLICISSTLFVNAKKQDESVELIPQPGTRDEEWRKEMFGDVPDWYKEQEKEPEEEDTNLERYYIWEYDRDKAAQYSDKYAYPDDPEKASPGYRHYGQDKDCTNFVSQALEAGGKPYKKGDRTSNRSWYYGWFSWTTSYTWGGSDNLFKHLRDYTDSEITTNMNNLEKADLIFIDIDNDGYTDHTMIVSKLSNSDLLLNYHSINKRREPLSRIKSKYPKSKFYGVKIRNGCGQEGCKN